MTTEAKIQLTSSELGALWMSYMSKSGGLLMHSFFSSKTIDKEAKDIKIAFNTETQNIKNQIMDLFNSQEVVIPIGFDEHDVIMESPPLFDDLFHIMFLRQMTKLNFGYSAIYSAMSYSKEVLDIYKLNYDVTNKYYATTTNYLLEKGVLAKPPNVTMPKQVEFIENKNYMSGHNPFSEKRSLNTLEVGFLNEAIEDNIFGMQL